MKYTRRVFEMAPHKKIWSRSTPLTPCLSVALNKFKGSVTHLPVSQLGCRHTSRTETTETTCSAPTCLHALGPHVLSGDSDV